MIPWRENCRIIFFLLNLHFSKTIFYVLPFPLKFDFSTPQKALTMLCFVTNDCGGAGGTVSGCAVSLCWPASWYPHHHWPVDTLKLQASPQQENPSQSYSTIQTLAFLKCVEFSSLWDLYAFFQSGWNGLKVLEGHWGIQQKKRKR